MIFELKEKLGIFVRADKITEITVSGSFAHVFLEDGHSHYVPCDEGGTPYDTAKRIMKQANECMYPVDTMTLDIDEIKYPFGKCPESV